MFNAGVFVIEKKKKPEFRCVGNSKCFKDMKMLIFFM